MEKPKFTGKHWEYETKCRRCGKLETWHLADKDSISDKQFFIAIQDYIEHPRIYECKNCKIRTIQDVTSYSMPE